MTRGRWNSLLLVAGVAGLAVVPRFAVGLRVASETTEGSVNLEEKGVTADHEEEADREEDNDGLQTCSPWCDAMEYDQEKSLGVFCTHPKIDNKGKKSCPTRTLMYDHINILKYPTYTNAVGKDYNWQQMLLIRNGLCPKMTRISKCFVNPIGATEKWSNRKKRCGACKMSQARKDVYLMALTSPKISPSQITKKLNGRPENMIMFGLHAIQRGYIPKGGGARRSFHNKLSLWQEFKRVCGFQCKTAHGLKFLPSTFDLADSADMASFRKEFNPSMTYLAKNEADAKKGIRLFQAPNVDKMMQDIKEQGREHNTSWLVLQEMLDNPALAKLGDGPGFKVNMRTFIVLSCSNEKREWTMLRAGSYLHYALSPYTGKLNIEDKEAFRAAVETSYNPDDLVLRGLIPHDEANLWPSSSISFLENLKEQGWTDDVDMEFKKIESIFTKAAGVYDGIVCNKQDEKVLKDVGQMFYLIGADILMTGTEVDGKKALQPYLIEWNSGPAFGDWGRPKDLEHKMITEIAALRKGGVLPPDGWMPLFVQKEYEKITADNFAEEGNVWTTVDSLMNPFSRRTSTLR